MSELYRKLKISLNPLIENFIFPPEKMGYTLLGPDILNPELRDIFLKINLDVKTVAIFCRPAIKLDNNRSEGIIHSDIMLDNNSWTTVNYAVNFELFDTSTRLSWWDVDGEKVYPQIPKIPSQRDSLRGIHFIKKENKEKVEYKHLDSVYIKKHAFLVNTSIPHSANYFGTLNTRWGVSVRFFQNYTWDEAVVSFQDLIIE